MNSRNDFDEKEDEDMIKEEENKQKSDIQNINPSDLFKSSICFLLSFDEKITSIICKLKNNFSEIKFENKTIFFYEIFLSDIIKSKEIPIYINNIPYIIKVIDIKHVNFLFHHKIINQNNNLFTDMNNLDIEDEFNLFYQISLNKQKIDEKNDYLKFLLSNSLNILESEKIFSTFSFFLAIYNKYQDFDLLKKYINNIVSIGNLKKIKETKVLNQELYTLCKMITDVNFLDNNIKGNDKNIIFECLNNYQNFINSIGISIDLDNILVNSNTFSELLILLKYIPNIQAFFIFIYKHREKFMKKFQAEKRKIIIDKYFILNNIDNEELSEEFFYCVYKLKRYIDETYKFLIFDNSLNDALFTENILENLKQYILFYLINNNANKEKGGEIESSLYDNSKKGLLINIELLILGEIMNSIEYKKEDFWIYLIKEFNLEKVNNEFIEIIKIIKIDWNFIFEIENFDTIICQKLKTGKYNDKIFLSIFKFLENSDKNEIKNDKKSIIYNKFFHDMNDTILFLIKNKKFIFNHDIQEKLSKFIYLCDKRSQECSFFKAINEENINKSL